MLIPVTKQLLLKRLGFTDVSDDEPVTITDATSGLCSEQLAKYLGVNSNVSVEYNLEFVGNTRCSIALVRTILSADNKYTLALFKNIDSGTACTVAFINGEPFFKRPEPMSLTEGTTVCLVTLSGERYFKVDCSCVLDMLMYSFYATFDVSSKSPTEIENDFINLMCVDHLTPLSNDEMSYVAPDTVHLINAKAITLTFNYME